MKPPLGKISPVRRCFQKAVYVFRILRGSCQYLFACIYMAGDAAHAGKDDDELRALAERMRDLLRKEKRIIHAGGAVKSSSGELYSYTNSREAFIRTAAAGKRFCELDVRRTKDRAFICSHIKEDSKRSLKEFKNKTLEGGFKTMTFAEVIRIMRKYPDVYAVLDIKQARFAFCRWLSHKAPDMKERFIIQIQHATEYRAISKLGFVHILYTLYNTLETERRLPALRRAAEKYPLVNISFWKEWAEDEDFMKGVCSTGVPVFLHTVNEDEEKYFELGAAGIYTDNIEKVTEWEK